MIWADGGRSSHTLVEGKPWCATPFEVSFFVVPDHTNCVMSRFGRFRSIVLMTKDLPKGVAVYRDGLGLPLLRSSDAMAEFDTGGTPLVLKAVEGEAKRSTGYSPFLCFDVADLDATLVKLLQLGASLDGPIKYPAYGKVAALRSPDGHMIGIFEPAVSGDHAGVVDGPQADRESNPPADVHHSP